MTTSLDPADAKNYRRRARVITAYGLIALLVGTAGILDRALLTTSSVVQTLDGAVAVTWLAAYALGGALAAGGVIWLRPDIELFGDWLLLGFAVLNAATIVLNRGPVGGGITAASLFLVAYVLHGRIGDLHHVARRDRRIRDVPIRAERRRP